MCKPHWNRKHVRDFLRYRGLEQNHARVGTLTSIYDEKWFELYVKADKCRTGWYRSKMIGNEFKDCMLWTSVYWGWHWPAGWSASNSSSSSSSQASSSPNPNCRHQYSSHLDESATYRRNITLFKSRFVNSSRTGDHLWLFRWQKAS